MTDDRRSTRADAVLPPLGGAVLIGGSSLRMGRSKHELVLDGMSFVERIVRTLAAVVHPVVVVGEGALPESLAAFSRRRDPEGMRGPAAGVVAALASDPARAWLVAACDQPWITPEALAWLIAQRAPGVAAVQARRASGEGRVEPFPGIYEPAARAALTELAGSAGAAGVDDGARRGVSLQRLATRLAVAVPIVPARLAEAFAGANTPEELARLAGARPER